jgi:hypothetical protein
MYGTMLQVNKNITFFLSKIAENIYPSASMTDVQATREAAKLKTHFKTRV